MVTEKDKKENRMTRSSDTRMTRSSGTRRNFFQKVADFFVRTAKKLKSFFVNLKAELKRVVWPDRKRLIQSTATVLAICILIGVLLFVVDSILGGTLNALGFYSPNVTTAATTTGTTTAAETTGSDATEGTTAAG